MFDLERHFDRFEIDHFLFVEYFRVLLDHDMKTFLRLVWLTNCSTWLPERVGKVLAARPLSFSRAFFQLICHGPGCRKGLCLVTNSP